MELYPNMKGGMKKIAKILKFGKPVWMKQDDMIVMKDCSSLMLDVDDEDEEDSSTPIADEVPTESDDVGLMKERHSSTPIADEVPTESDDVGLMKERDSSTSIAVEVPTESDDVGLMKERDSSTLTWSTLDNKWQSVEERKNLQKQFEAELNKYIFDMTQNSLTSAMEDVERVRHLKV
jgi:hypothetical protein